MSDSDLKLLVGLLMMAAIGLVIFARSHGALALVAVAVCVQEQRINLK